MKVSVCIPTYRRPDRLARVLDDLVAQRLQPHEVVVVDNDADGSAAAVVARRRDAGAPFALRYEVQPLKNISLTRNRTVALAGGDWLAFIDDDERAGPDWLDRLVQTALQFDADGVLAPVEPVVPADAPAWIRRGSFYRWARMPTGTVVPMNRLRLGNALLRAALLRDDPAPFDPAYGVTGGEDGDLFGRLMQHGARFVWCDEAVVTEPVEASRLRLRWMLLRALRGGQDHARHRLAGRFGEFTALACLAFVLQALVQAGVAGLLALLTWPTGRHRAVHWMLKMAGNVGKLSLLLGWHYREYGEKPA